MELSPLHNYVFVDDREAIVLAPQSKLESRVLFQDNLSLFRGPEAMGLL